ncbi:beta-L-arabinofuranosidase domain-containing protein [Streptomyces sp. NPDC051572]|uniref:beta-L-arabinofuranosidase domain-containing protein n=1 Tax=Streptomyces sp. NPDC051572 TaxID=3155802 RepID=UPI00344B2C82
MSINAMARQNQLPLSAVRLDAGPFRNAQDLDAAYLLSLEPDRLLAPFFREAGLPMAEPAYGNWESQGLDGHTAGHYLAATSLMFAARGDERFRSRAQAIVDGLALAQQATGTGYVGGIPDGRSIWAEIAAGRIDPSTFKAQGRWVPLYNLHKTFAGLIEAYRTASIRDALTVVTALADWWMRLAESLSEDSFELMLDTEFGGMNESFADLAAITGRDDYLAMARRFTHHTVFDPLAAGEDRLAGIHANTQIPKVLGYQRIAALTDDKQYGRASRFFFNTVTTNHTVSIGGHGVREHFHDPTDFSSMFEEREGPETCNTVNLVRLAANLNAVEPNARYLDYIEIALHNHLLSAIHPSHGGFVYFTPMRPRHYRMYSASQDDFWCCVGTSMEAHAQHGAYIYAEHSDDLYVNLFIDSTVTWHGMTLQQRAVLGGGVRTAITVPRATGDIRSIKVRVPSWASSDPIVHINGVSYDETPISGYLTLRRQWQHGDQITVELPSRPRLVHPGDGSGWVSIVDGPIVLAAEQDRMTPAETIADATRVSHIARGPLEPLAESPIVVDESLQALVDRDGEGNVWLHTDQGPVAMRPFADIHDARYTVYFPQGDIAERRIELTALDEAQLSTDTRTRDSVTIGEQQPEADHHAESVNSTTGREDGVAWRRTGHTMSVTLTDWHRMANTLRVSWLEDSESIGYDVVVNGVRVHHFSSEGSPTQETVGCADFMLPETIWDSDSEHVRVELAASPGHFTHRVTELRLMS